MPGREVVAILADGGAPDGCCSNRGQFMTRPGIPNNHRAIITCSNDMFSIWAKARILYYIGVSCQSVELVSAFTVPNECSVIPSWSGDLLAIRAKGNVSNLVFRPRKRH